MFKSLVMFCLILVSLLSRQGLKCVNLKLPSHVNMGVLKKASLKTSLMKMLCLELLECLSQVVTKFDGVIARSSPNEKENAHSPNVPMFSPKGEVIHEISLQVKIYLEKSV